MAYGRLAYIGKVITSHTMANKTILMTPDNICMICSDIKPVSNISAGGTVFTLPDASLYPDNPVTVLVPLYSSSNATTNYYRIFTLGTDGKVTTRTSISTTYTIQSNGMMWHINDNYYNDALGNNDMTNMTSPINYD